MENGRKSLNSFDRNYSGKIERSLRSVFSTCIQEGSGYIPSLWLYKNNRKVISIICRNTDGSLQDKDLAFVEMFTTIASVDPDKVVFCADSFFDSAKIVDDSSFNQKEIFKNIERSGVSAMFIAIETKYNLSKRIINPYFQSEDNRMWWVDCPELRIGRDSEYNQPEDVVNDRTSDHIRKMMGMVGSLPFSTATHFDMLSSLGHEVSVASYYHVGR